MAIHNIDSVIAAGVSRERGGRIAGIGVEQIKRKAAQSLYDMRTRARGKTTGARGQYLNDARSKKSLRPQQEKKLK